MRLLHTPESKLKLSEALRQMSETLDILDGLDAPGAIGTSLDLAIARLEEFLTGEVNSTPRAQNLFDQLEIELASVRELLSDEPVPWGVSPR